MSTEQEYKRKCTVYRDCPEWDKHSRWFMVPTKLLNELYVVTYEAAEDDFLDCLPDIESKHPGCVFIY